MKRRDFLRLTGGTVLAAGTVVWPVMAAASAPEKEKTGKVILSTEGSGRATAYLEQNKIITIGDKTHVAWQDGGEQGFRIFVRTLDRTTGIWSASVLIGPAQDNHGGPSLTVDSQGYLHIVYYPHHDACRYRRSVRPNDASEWTPEVSFGEGLTYPAMVCGADDTLYVVARRGYHDAQGKPIESERVALELWKKPATGDWQRAATLIRSRYPGYAQFAASLAWGPDHRTLHLGCRIYEGNPFIGGYQAYTAGYMTSADEGATWTKADGTAIKLPATAEMIDVVAKDAGLAGPALHIGAIAVNKAGVPHLLYSATYAGASRLYLSTPAPGLGWTRRDLSPQLPDGWQHSIIYLNMAGGISFSDSGRATIAAVLFRRVADEKPDLVKDWGNPGTEIVRLWSDDGFKQIQSEMLQPEDSQVPHWLPNLERATGFNVVPDEPGIIYTAGGAGGHVKDQEVKTRILWHAGN